MPENNDTCISIAMDFTVMLLKRQIPAVQKINWEQVQEDDIAIHHARNLKVVT